MQDKYLNTYTKRSCDHSLYVMHKWSEVANDAIIIIPAYRESYATLKATLHSLNKVASDSLIEVMILINYKASDSVSIKDASAQLESALIADKLLYPKLKLTVFLKQLSGKQAGVGMARKLLMDCAYLRFRAEDKNGIIINLDADTIVQYNYLESILEKFNTKTIMDAASIAFAHPIDKQDSMTEEQSIAITLYELHLRYFINMQRWVGLPYAYQTVGSAMAARAHAYAKVGGMNVRQAGEDFYFLHKFSKLLTLEEINSTVVLPSARASERVPFGTGKAVSEYLDGAAKRTVSYHPDSFVVLKEWLSKVEKTVIDGNHKEVSVEDEALATFLEKHDCERALKQIITSTKSAEGRIKKFYAWFDAFKLFKYLHHARDVDRPDVVIMKCVSKWAQLYDTPISSEPTVALKQIRQVDIKTDYSNQWRADLMARLSNTSAS